MPIFNSTDKANLLTALYQVVVNQDSPQDATLHNTQMNTIETKLQSIVNSISASLDTPVDEGILTKVNFLAWLVKNDGKGSNIDADFLDGISSENFFRIQQYGGDLNLLKITGSYNLSSTITNFPTGVAKQNDIVFHLAFDTNNAVQHYYSFNSPNSFYRFMNGGVWSSWSKIWNSNNDGSGSGLDADTFDGYNSTDFALLNGETTVPFQTKTAALFDNSNLAASTSFLMSMLGNTSGIVSLNANTSLTKDHYGKIIELQDSVVLNQVVSVALPPPQVNGLLHFVNNSLTGNVAFINVPDSNANTFYLPSAHNPALGPFTSIYLYGGQSVTIASNGVRYDIVDGTYLIHNNSDVILDGNLLANPAIDDNHVPSLGQVKSYVNSKLVQYYDIQGGFGGLQSLPTQIILQYPSVRTVIFPDSWSNSQAFARVAPTGTVTFSIYYYNKTNQLQTYWGSITFAANTNVGVFAPATGYVGTRQLNPGDVLNIYGNATIDPTLADVSMTLFGNATI